MPTLEKYVEGLPHYYGYDIVHFWEGFNAMWQSPLTLLHDDKLRRKFEMLHSWWKETSSYDDHYEPSYSPRGGYLFTTLDNSPLDDRQWAAWEKIERAARALKTAVRDLIIY